MQLDMMEIVGLLAGGCTTASFVPQVLHTWRTKSVDDISLRMYLLLTVGIVMWLFYGIHIDSLSVIIANSVTLILAVAILSMKLAFGRKPSAKNLDRRPK
ncbi:MULTISPECIES: SemiSWEET transporter [unclassified Pseudodesulfovibrio]|uniref:SemiSWEET family sugar transporter n=1 Tax=unclassified Pseudodesulfovibrio TaxID=2661612 RepID=UPI001F4F256C|nr:MULTISPECIES: SemiSWEET transporter [unclassified Pseudodesulfovibrio]MCJ2165909.1 SemiSWEET transporter [Pseudodesulfovibrio sp. S3-i]